MSTRRPNQGRLLVLGLDGASFNVLDPLGASGRLPHLTAWRSAGSSGALESTVPPMSFPAGSTFMTGLDPGQHGIFDFTEKVPGAYRVRFVNATHRRGESLFARVSGAGLTSLVLGMPATFPPEPIRGLLVSGFDSPVSAGSDSRSASDPGLYRNLTERVGPWMAQDLDQRAREDGWHERAAEGLLARIERKTAFAVEALEQLEARGSRPDVGVVVFSESDTVCHHFWRDHDPRSPRHDPSASLQRRDAIASVFERLDQACGEIRRAFGEDAPCVVMSDHGARGAGRHVVHLGRHLWDCGWLQRARPRSQPLSLDRIARGARDGALALLSPRAAEKIFRRTRSTAARLESIARFGGIDWGRTVAFAEEVNTQPGVWINLRGREAEGCVAPADYERVRQGVIDSLLGWKLPDGQAAIARARPREEVYDGPCVERAPDIVVELATDHGYGLSLVHTPWASEDTASIRRLDDAELGGGRGRGMNGTHRPDGIWIAHGGAECLDAQPGMQLRDAVPRFLEALGIPHELEAIERAAHHPNAASDYTHDEEDLVAKRLRDLGYLE